MRPSPRTMQLAQLDTYSKKKLVKKNSILTRVYEDYFILIFQNVYFNFSLVERERFGLSSLSVFSVLI